MLLVLVRLQVRVLRLVLIRGDTELVACLLLMVVVVVLVVVKRRVESGCRGSSRLSSRDGSCDVCRRQADRRGAVAGRARR